ncbi:hypothetical protein [Parasitella parasitica]|uniref:Ndc10 domain-containing protein n=1 Tax=Parasitella parasitica TaxID=35722 RepID=A0A0B7NIM8_9FUNG|nr:hypothetical protein [Parasitella parasitica]
MIVNSKTNQEHKKIYSGGIQHKEVNAYAFGALDLCLSQRFHEDNDDFPRFQDKSDWFSIRAFKLTRVESKKLTHAGRGSGARDTEMAGATVDRIKRMR